jgi:hypothetical protein
MEENHEDWEARLEEIQKSIVFDEDGLDDNEDPLAYHLLEVGAPASFLLKVCGSFSLYTALNYNQFDKRVPELLDAGADPNENTVPSSPLHLAAWTSTADVVAALLRAGANPKALDSKGRTPLDVAERNQNEEAIRVLRSCHLEVVLPPPAVPSSKPQM